MSFGLTNPNLAQAGAFTYASRDAINAAFAQSDTNFAAIAAGLGLTSQDGITAHAGGGQANAFQITAAVNRVGTVATAGDSIALPLATAGAYVIVVNDANGSIQVFANPSGTDTINDVAGATGIGQGANTFALYACTATGKWFASITSFGVLAVRGANGALAAHGKSSQAVLTKAGVAVMTLAAPIAGTDDGNSITVFSSTADAHTVTATGILNNGANGSPFNTATFPAFPGASITLTAYNGQWYVTASSGAITYS